MSRGRIAFIDDEAELVAAAADWLEASGFDVRSWTAPKLALAQIEPQQFDVVLTDLRMPELSGDRLLDALRARDPDLPVVLMSAHADIAIAVEAMRKGAHDFIEKPYQADQLVTVLQNAIDWGRMRRDMARSRSLQSRLGRIEQRLPGRSGRMQQLREAIAQLAEVPVDLLLLGEIGTGREGVARLLHELSRREKRQFLALDCSAQTEAALEADLFGHERGALPGTSSERVSRIEFATGGTLYLSEIHALSPALQARLFRVIQDRSLTRMGGKTARAVELRLIASSSQDLRAAMEQGRFRQDLYFHLSAASLQVPSLAERREDIPPLYASFLAEAAARFRRPLPELGPVLIEALKLRPWPGNLAQLQAEAAQHALGLSHAPPVALASASDPPRPSLPEQMAAIEARLIAEALERCNGASALAAQELGIPRRTLNEKILRYNLREP